MDRSCALCLDTLPPKTESKVCKKCYEKHNNQVKYGSFQFPNNDGTADHSAKDAVKTKSLAESLPEHYCNLCQKSLNTATELEEHLIEHSFRGLESYNCYICSAIFTLPCGLRHHITNEHGPSYRPYDCNLCAKKFYFRAELENHLIDHENGRISTPNQQQSQTDANSNASNDSKYLKREHDNEYNRMKESNEEQHSDNERDKDSDSEQHQQQNACETNAAADDDDDDEYIEVEKIGENSTINHESRLDNKSQHSERDDKYDEND